MGIKNANGPSHKYMQAIPILPGLSHLTLVCPYRWKECQWSFPIVTWSFPIGVKSIDGPSHKYMQAFPIPPGLSL
ncbi:hypothetical protein M405DRAFT_863661 [Rhizopogon salebrosus TDB-379]|nr:hypothetical protein M405DRAFT_863661 [Rhizopogon salebrosus TDB-379]